MKLLVKTKLLEGKYCELREYEMFKVPLKVVLCTSKDYGTCLHVGEEYMTFSLNEQKEGKITNTQQSKFPPYSYYRLFKFLWKPKGKIRGWQLDEKNLEFKNKNTILIP